MILVYGLCISVYFDVTLNIQLAKVLITYIFISNHIQSTSVLFHDNILLSSL